jgi:hypothetical protein
MTTRRTDDLGKLKYQSLGREISPAERAVADAMLAYFRTGATDFDAMAAEFQSKGLARPSGETGPWTRDVLQSELARINDSLDAAYAENGIGS